MMSEYNIKCRFNSSMIEVEGGFENESQDLVGKMARKIINLEDKAVREALIKLGWTPPCDKSAVNKL